MTRLPIVLATAAIVAVGSTTAPSSADARVRGRAVAAGVLGFAAGAAIAGAASRSYGYDPYGYDAYAYAPSYGYYSPGYAYAPTYGYAPFDGYYGYYGRPATSDLTNRDRMLTGTR